MSSVTTRPRPTVKISDVKVGTVLFTDGGFTCMRPNSIATVYGDASGLFVRCDDGDHYLDGQEDGEVYVGFRLG